MTPGTFIMALERTAVLQVRRYIDWQLLWEAQHVRAHTESGQVGSCNTKLETAR